VVETASNGAALIAAANKHQPDVLVLDISMPGLNGFQTARQLLDTNAKAKIVFLTIFSDQASVTEALSIGALGYVVKTALHSELAFAVKEASEGRQFISPSITIG
jgi:DNA-binding NarL/FixJ family response regulator